MIVGSINIRGLGGRVKKSKVRGFIATNHLDFVAIQETKLEAIDDNLCHFLWGNSSCCWSFIPALGSSGGILSIWCSSKGNAVYSFSGLGYVGVCLEWGVAKSRCFVVNIYSKCSLPEKRTLWNSLVKSRRAFSGDVWCVVGDFNAVLDPSERRGGVGLSSTRYDREMLEFADFVSSMDLIDLPLLGRRFTWFQPSGGAMSRLDRFLVTGGWLDMWGVASQWALPRDVSDHCPIVLRYLDQLWGPKPFRFNNYWLDHRALPSVVQQSWEQHNNSGWMAFKLKEKLKSLKGSLKIWNKEVFGDIDHKIDLQVETIKEIDLKAESGLLSLEEDTVRKQGLANLWRLMRCKENQIVQRSRSRWLKEGDANTSFFHNSVRHRKRRNSILAIRVGDRWVERVTEVRAEIVDYFTTHFSETTLNRPTLDGMVFQHLLEEDDDVLCGPFSFSEIELAVATSDGNKSPGPDGFNFSFFKRFWDLIKVEVGVMFDQFYSTATLPRSFSSYFITLIPKVVSPFRIGDFRPISLVGSLYKLVAKVLAGRLAKVIDKLISPNQSAFIRGRQLVDGVVAVNEIIDLAKQSRKECLIFKVDFEKAYDSVSWTFLDYMMQRFGFGVRWRRWIKACVFCGNLSILVNGSPTKEINIQRGLKQGDPLAPFLFLLVVEGLSAAVRTAEEKNLYSGFKVGNSGVSISHLQYADDTIFLGEASAENLWSIKAILRGFELASGLKVNFGKSKVMGVNVSSEFLGVAERFLHCSQTSLPFMYLGLPVGANPRKISTWKPLTDTIARKLGSWNNKWVSLGGRVVLLNSVLNSIPIFYLSFLKMPVRVWKLIVKM
jgi:hypothetical protein